MTTTTLEKITTPEAVSLPVKVRQKPGPKPKAPRLAPIQEIIDMTAPQAADILRKHIERKQGWRTLPPGLQRACEYIIDHAIGKARQKVEHSGGIMTYDELAKAAGELDKKPRPILADVLELAQKYQEDNPVKGEASGDTSPGG
ncbi:MAG: hypothetical protein KJ556_21465 [Gammaproteobacteria bacterium]|nr:hypothetical protein [Gammaproteobacteria bacterium]